VGRTGRVVTLVAIMLALMVPALAAAQDTMSARPFTYLLRGGLVVDGTGAPPFHGDVAIHGDRIVRVSRTPLDPTHALHVIDARGLVVTPGFIDAHAHVENLVEQPYTESFVRQGVTTVWYAADGGMPWPLRDEIAALERSSRATTPSAARSWARRTARPPPRSWSR
jgi:imidazolonepropionase-like amidohydrolase